MCGIFYYKGDLISEEELKKASKKISYRGPDNSKSSQIDSRNFFDFHRLSIIGNQESGNQPMTIKDYPHLTIVCNGEIYNYKKLAREHNVNLSSGSDTEIILHLFEKFGIEKTVKCLDGVFMFVLYDKKKGITFSARDPFGVRPGFFGTTRTKNVAIASEAKALIDFCDDIIPFPPGSIWSSSTNDFVTYYTHAIDQLKKTDEVNVLAQIKNLLFSSVEKRMMSEREIGALVSGGLDSSLIAAIANSFSDKKLKTFSIGMKGSIDLEYAKTVADFIQTDHAQIEIKESEFLGAIETVIYNIESFDITTIRASIGNYLVSRYIKENSDCKVIFNGDGSDEVCGGYLYMMNAPTPEIFQEETLRLLNQIYLFDVLRSDRSISSNGLEARTPFLDKTFVEFYLSIPPELKVFNNKDRIEKFLLRKSFHDLELIPQDVLWRKKCAFSDGVSSQKNSWHKVLQHYIDLKVSDAEFEKNQKSYKHCPPISKESYFYRKIFESTFSNHEKLIPFFWMPRWTDTNDPSARELSDYQE